VRKEVAEKFGISQKHISTLIKGIYQKINFLFGIKPRVHSILTQKLGETSF